MERHNKSSASSPQRETDSFRQLVERKITVEDYIKSLDNRVAERRIDAQRPRRASGGADAASA